MFKKIIAVFFIIFIFSSSYVESNSSNLSIEKLIPHRGEQNIISTPEIKIIYKSSEPLNNFKLYLNYKDITNKTIVTSKYIYYKCDKKLKRGVQVARLEVFSQNNSSPQVTEWYFTVGTSFYNHYRGVFFNNTDDLNILTSYDDLNNLCKNTKHFNFLFLTEKFNNKEVTVDTIVDSKKWQKLTNSCNNYCDNYNFISIPGFELSSKLEDEENETKVNIFNCQNPFTLKNNINFELFYKKLFYLEEDLICQFENYNNLNDINYFKYSPYGDSIISLLQLKSNNNKGSLNLAPYTEALDNGWHISPITCEYNQYPNTDIKNNFTTTILSEELTKSQLLNALKNRRIYISSNSSMDVSFSLNKLPMGSIIKNPSYIRIIASAIDNTDTSKIKKIEIFSNNHELIYEKTFDSNFAKIDFTLPIPDKNTYYFALITDKNNKQTLTSPIWVEH